MRGISLFVLAPFFIGFSSSQPHEVYPRARGTTGVLQRQIVNSTECPGTFEHVSAEDYVAASDPGWNLGNTLDAIQTEGDWNNPKVESVTFEDARAAGFSSVRIPVTWAYHFITDGPTWTVDPDWLQRVSDVIDMALSYGFYVITNVHHDSWNWYDFSKPDADVQMIEEKFYRLWYQIGVKLACKSSKVAFEPINEPPGSTSEHAAQQNRMNEIFLKAIQDAGGFNAQRVVTLVGLGEDTIKTSQWFKPPMNISNPWALQYHYYSPYDFIFGAWGKTIWGSEADITALESDIANVRNNFTQVPLIIGEWSASPIHTETAARWKFYDHFIRLAKKYNTSTMLWDNGADQLDRTVHIWRDPVAIDVLMSAQKGEVNSLPDSTKDAAAESQFSSAFLFHHAGTMPTDQKLPFVFNGNTLDKVTAGSIVLEKDWDYFVASDSITFKSNFVSNFVRPSWNNFTSSIGIAGGIVLSFSQGADICLRIVQWDTPTLLETTSMVDASEDLYIPISWKGLSKPAAVRAMKSDGGILVDDWTQWLGPLQRGRLTFDSHYNWDSAHLILRRSLLESVVNSGQNVTITVEGFPRVPGNEANYTLTVV
ncbi:glycoside hydrolase family 5 protein [Patellaria atrata CBS 101060]|uniref:Glycoside hydrolase family 5 protein n=1 Tax=Patellaria atrata CBS 101060 TaxID=1346257 RepID=A0A9P4VKA4_9PEZI|nr:glycoside hydrolase family 5 protein [Patellaria atrata CBS 101060]